MVNSADEGSSISEAFPDEQLFSVATEIPRYVDFVNYLACKVLSLSLSSQQKKNFCHDVKQYNWDDLIIFKHCTNLVIRRCSYDRCQCVGNISRRHELPLTNILEVEIFDVWGIDFMGPFPPLFGNLYILLVVDYVSKWVETTTITKNDARVLVKFIQKNIFSIFGTPREILSDEGTHFANKVFDAPMEKKDFSNKLDDALSVYKPAFKKPIGMCPYRIVFGKACHLPFKLEHHAQWAIKKTNFDLEASGEKRLLQLNELEEIRHKERTKKWHDKKILRREFVRREGPFIQFSS
ncbi:uncharacterized protein LOC133819743 [Humulus lupulus]|uniref:uncharacterized protein LOC133819743 n=1 Tax=Humulus lupulus TaxID=3486 RepID=UPI002B41236D|nr:uncharacterized protein LOC133819743 [Humulus lupulus]